MPAPKGHKKWGGRKKGTPNKSTQDLFKVCEEEGIDVFRAMVRLAVKEDEPQEQFRMLKEIAEYLYPKRKAVEHSGNVGAKPSVLRLMNGDELVFTTEQEEE